MRSRRICILAIGTALAIAAPGAAHAAVLVDQTNSPGANASDSNDFNVGNDTADNQTADDFAVPAGQSWLISRVEVIGQLSPMLPPPIINAFLYANSGTLPGAELFHQSNIPSTGAPNYSVPLSGDPALAPGTYWVSIQQAGATFMQPSWTWTTRTVQSGSPAAFRNPGGASNSLCPAWAPRVSCVLFYSDPGQLFRLTGTASSNPFKLGKLKRNTKEGTARLRVKLPGPGTLDLRGKGLVTQHLRQRSVPVQAAAAVSAARPLKLLIKPRGKSRRILGQRHKVQLDLTLTYTATGADSTVQRHREVLKKAG